MKKQGPPAMIAKDSFKVVKVIGTIAILPGSGSILAMNLVETLGTKTYILLMKTPVEPFIREEVYNHYDIK